MSQASHSPEHQIPQDLLELAAGVFEPGDVDGWFRRHHPLLGRSPAEAAQTPEGAARVRQMLVAIKYGGSA